METKDDDPRIPDVVRWILEQAQTVPHLKGYRIEIDEEGRHQRLIRPDGTVAMIATMKPKL